MEIKQLEEILKYRQLAEALDYLLAKGLISGDTSMKVKDILREEVEGFLAEVFPKPEEEKVGEIPTEEKIKEGEEEKKEEVK